MPAPFPDMAAPSFLVARTASTNGSNGSHDEAGAVNGFALAEAEAAAGVETEIGTEADDDIDFAARLESLTVAPAVVVPPFPSEVWEAEPIEPARPEAVPAEAAPEPIAEAEPIAATAEPVAATGRRVLEERRIVRGEPGTGTVRANPIRGNLAVLVPDRSRPRGRPALTS